MTSISVIGCGPMGLYALKRLVSCDRPLDITIFESSSTPGIGMPYRSDTTSDEMLCNAFSREIPSFTQPFVDWLRDQPSDFLARFGISPENAGSRDFYPRTLLGLYLGAEFDAITARAEQDGHRIVVRARHQVTDVVPQAAGTLIKGNSPDGDFSIESDEVIIATGHRWPEDPEIGGVPLVSPWPAERLTGLPAGRIGVIGASLSAIDVTLTLAATHGSFDHSDAGVRWLPNDGSDAFRVTLLSQKGIMPEPDFWYPFPYEPLAHLSEQGVADEIEKGAEGLLERLFDLLLRDLDAEDPAYLEQLGEGARSIEGFGPAYFARRAEVGGLRSVRNMYRDALDAVAKKETIPSRYVLLRADANFDLGLRALGDADYDRFRKHLLPVFADAYAAVPHRSVQRLLALHEAGVLALQSTGSDVRYAALPEGRVSATVEGEEMVFDVMIDARGQQAEGVDALPFPSLTAQLGPEPVTEPFRLDPGETPGGGIYCLALPQLLERYPFSQGLENCSELSRIAVDDLLGRLFASDDGSVACDGTSVREQGASPVTPDVGRGSERPAA
ncbi:FAD/NAD(P)-binding protein [Sulfitobacter sp. LCG007]